MSWLGSVNSPRREREKSYRGREGKFCGTRSSKITKENMFTRTDTNPELLLEKSIPCFAKKLKKKISVSTHENTLHCNTEAEPSSFQFLFTASTRDALFRRKGAVEKTNWNDVCVYMKMQKKQQLCTHICKNHSSSYFKCLYDKN